MEKRQFVSTAEAAKILGISRIAVHKKIQKGEISAHKVGRNYIIARNSLVHGFMKPMTDAAKHQIERAVHRTVREYGETLRLLGKE